MTLAFELVALGTRLFARGTEEGLVSARVNWLDFIARRFTFDHDADAFTLFEGALQAKGTVFSLFACDIEVPGIGVALHLPLAWSTMRPVLLLKRVMTFDGALITWFDLNRV